VQKSINPWTGETIDRYVQHGDIQVNQTLEKARLAFRHWPMHVPVFARAEPILALARLLRAQRETLALLITQEMGKLYRESLAEVDKCAFLCEVYAEKGAEWLEPEHIATEAKKSFVQPVPLGVILLVMPWNFPFWQVIRAAVPAILAGNAVLLKHASNVPRCALVLEKLFLEAGFAQGLFQTLLIPSSKVEALIRHPLIRGVSLTGSEKAGRSVAGICGQELKKVVLELGGSDPFIVLEDANLDKALNTVIKSRFINGGQSCIAAKRLIVDRYHYDDFVAALHARLSQLKVGDPMDENTDIPPMARPDLRDELHDQVVTTTAAQGARLICGGKAVENTLSAYYPTLLADIQPGMTAFDEETFGPVLTVTKASDIPHALSLANATRFGLGSTVFTADGTTAQTLAESLHSGCTFVNDLMHSDPRLPFGGVGDSGLGREMGRLGLLEFTNLKTIWYGQ
jgi:succinate-semialdehyde dehydrogenase/glutarate-semialdehyde dehydrogenase